MQAFFEKNVTFFVKKLKKKVNKALVFSFSGRFPCPNELFAPQKISNGHGFFA